jgi:hypothetical protein
MSMRLMIEEREAEIGAIHAVCTREPWRRRGLARGLLQDALRESEGLGHGGQILFAADPAIYRSLGFRPVRPHVFVGRAPRVKQTVASRPLDLDVDADLSLVRSRLSVRSPPSYRYAVVAPRELVLLDHALQVPPDRRFAFVEPLDAVIVYRCVDDLLHVEDVFAERVPSLADIVQAVPQRVCNVVLHFAPDRLATSTPLVPEMGLEPDTMMVRGAVFERGLDFAVPPLARW